MTEAIEGPPRPPSDALRAAATASAPSSPRLRPERVVVVGGGPAGLMAAEVLSTAGVGVELYDAMPSVGRKFLLAGKGGLNLTHGEPLSAFVTRYHDAGEAVSRWLEHFGPEALRAWAAGLGVETFVGSSGRVFPLDMKSAPLLRRWLHRLRESGVRFHTRHRWCGWEDGHGSEGLRFATAAGSVVVARADAVVLALGGASWPQLGSDGRWVPILQRQGVTVAPLRPSNCGFEVGRRAESNANALGDSDVTPAAEWLRGWSPHLQSRWAGTPVKTVGLSVGDPADPRFSRRGEFVVTDTGVEGSLIYAASHEINARLAAQGHAVVHLDLLPDRSLEWVRDELLHPRGSRSLATHIKSRLGIEGVKAALLHEWLPRSLWAELPALAGAIKALPMLLVAARPIAEAISSAGGVRRESLTPDLMLVARPGVFCAGEMLDWDAPTGGYLLTASMASGFVAAQGVLSRLKV